MAYIVNPYLMVHSPQSICQLLNGWGKSVINFISRGPQSITTGLVLRYIYDFEDGVV
jgi:hypothetical protein